MGAYVVISHGKRCGVAVEVKKGYPKSFYHCGAYCVWESDWDYWKKEVK